MNFSWYQKCMPRIKDVTPYIEKISEDIKKIEGIKSLYVWGSYAKNINHPDFRVKDIDILVKSSFHSGDLVSLDKNILNTTLSDEKLEEQGYDPKTIKFSKELLNVTKYNIDHWAISSDNKLLHWGPISINKEEFDDINKKAEIYASDKIGYNRKKISKSANEIRDNWYGLYHDYVNQFFSDMPSGWYQTEDADIKEILKSAIKL